MKEQYVGDVNDYRKYALLRLLGRSGLRLGVCWMLTPPDGRSDGNKLGYLDQSKQEHHDPELFALLRRARNEPDSRLLVLIEGSEILPGAVFVNTTVPETLFERQLWFRQASAALTETDLIFFDPDNGIEVGSVGKGRRSSSKYVYRDELAATYRAGHSLVVYQHFQRKERESLIRDVADDLRRAAPYAEIWAIRTSHVVFMLAIQPRHRPALSAAARHILETADPSFLHAQLIASASP
ncbi:MAG: hypothetical protein GY873_29305 [Bosea sp.]|uniref:hypothetical protein n=1 Tax=Bosea sp. (in: a-proteobacteria) TaxID=1871050 RepID=UPI002388B7A6|nr:hypothetical protein [Bosea sp. (in: a-proteobacteria)]MCP4738294.1 hypothetical protein [Bosea sp. (in: a-proteobacteria)]